MVKLRSPKPLSGVRFFHRPQIRYNCYMQIVNFVPTENVLEKVEILFSDEKEKLSVVLPYAEIEHIGATSVPGTITKGDLDINVRVNL